MQVHLFQHDTRDVQHELHERDHGTLRVVTEKGADLALHFHSAAGLDALIERATALRAELANEELKTRLSVKAAPLPPYTPAMVEALR
jgi:hypothetical protein